MRLLITTQAVDLDDPVLAFFHVWIEKFSTHFAHVHVICLKEGRHALPANVHVHSLGKETGESRIKYIRRFLKYVWNLRAQYDTVFVHMNPEYLVLAGWLWRILRKPTTLWYIHPRSSWRLFIARIVTNYIVSATTKSFPLHSRKLIAVGHGINTDFFSPPVSRESSADLRVMLAARLAPVKRVECVIAAVSRMVRENAPIRFDYYGTALPRDKDYEIVMQKMVPAAMPPDVWEWKGDATQEVVRDAYRSHDVHINATDSGSFDKAVFESMASGCITVVSNTALKGIVPDELLFKEGDSDSLVEVLRRIAAMDEPRRTSLRARMRAIAEEKYSLSALIGRLAAILKS
jgi:glycosyltransferase involved in cell wall biosynthesis